MSRRVLITGASSGLGQHAADVFLAAGAKVVGTARRRDALEGWQAKGGSNAAIVAADVADLGALAAMVEAIAAPFGAPEPKGRLTPEMKRATTPLSGGKNAVATTCKPPL